MAENSIAKHICHGMSHNPATNNVNTGKASLCGMLTGRKNITVSNKNKPVVPKTTGLRNLSSSLKIAITGKTFR
jgi:hypothetical protein